MTVKDRKKLAQLSRRLEAAQARYKSLEKRAGSIENKREIARGRASRALTLLYSKRGESATATRKKSLEAAFIKANREAERLSKIEDTIYSQLKATEEKIAQLEDGMKQRTKKNPRYLITVTRKRVEKDVDLGVLQDATAKKALSRAKAIYKGYTNMKARKRNPAITREDAAMLRAYVDQYVYEGQDLKTILSWLRQAGFNKSHLSIAKKAYAAAKKRKNPGAKQTLQKAGKALKKAVKSTLDAGSGLLKAGSKALANPHKSIRVKNSYIDLVIKGQAKKTPKGWQVGKKTFAQGRGTTKVSSNYYLDKATGLVYSKRQRNQSKKRNPSPQTIRKKFAGRLGPGRDLYFPKGAPQGLAKLGKLVSIKVKGLRKPITPTTRNPVGEVWLCSDTDGQLWLGSTVKAPLVGGSAQRLGEVSQIEYEESKPHLGYGKTVWFHHMGEEGGKKPVLYVDNQGDLIFKGGSYKIKREGITN